MINFTDYLDKGGVIFSLLLIFSVIAVAIIIYKFFEIFLFSNVNFNNFLTELDHSKDLNDFKETIFSGSSSAKNIFLIDLIKILESNSIIEQNIELEILLESEFRKAQRLLPTLEIIAQASPLIGLLGTVLGMIDSFNELELGGSLVDPSILAGGIWTALLTTAMGLIVAIPALICHYFYEKSLYNQQRILELFLTKLSKKI